MIQSKRMTPQQQQQPNHCVVVQSSLVLPIGTCRRRPPTSTIATIDITSHSRVSNTNSRSIRSDLKRNSVIPTTCRYVFIHQVDGKVPSFTTRTKQRLLLPPTSTTTIPVWYLCRMLVADLKIIQDDTNNSIDQNDRSLQHHDNTALSTMEYFECALNVTVIGYDPTSSLLLSESSNEHIPVIIDESSLIHDPFVVATTILRPIPTSTTTTTTTTVITTTHDAATNPSFLVPFDCPQPIPISSVFMTYRGISLSSSSSSTTTTTLSHLPLLQSCLKRQLVGCSIGIFHRKLTTTTTTTKHCKIEKCIIPTTQIQFIFDQICWTFIVDSVTPTITSTSTSTTTPTSPPTTTRNITTNNNHNEMDIGIILPSTRITFIHPITKLGTVPNTTTSSAIPTITPSSLLLSSNTHSDLYKSPAVRILVDTIQCIHRIVQNTPSLSSMANPIPMMGDIPRVFLLSGPPGVGKTHAIRTVVNMVSTTTRNNNNNNNNTSCRNDDDNEEFQFPVCHLIVLQGSEILSMGQQYSDAAHELERFFQNAIQQMRNNTNITILFLDECDALLSSSNNESSSIIIESTLGRLLDQMNQVPISTGGDPVHLRLVVVAATNRVDAIPSSLRRPGRFDREIPMVPPNATTRLQIIQSLLTTTYDDADDDDDSSMVTKMEDLTLTDMRHMADLCVGFVPADLAAVVRKVELLRMTQIQIPETLDVNNAEMMIRTTSIPPLIDIWTRAISEVGASALRDAALTAPPTTQWDDIAGDPGGAKSTLRQAIEWPRTKRIAYDQLGLTPPRGILLHGPPGCAKTTMARAAAGASAVSFLSLSPADVYSTSYVGDAEAVIRRAFTLARSASPCVLFFDEIDAILGMDENHSSHGMGRGSAVEARVLSTFLNEMDGVDGSWRDGVLVLGATNRPWTLDNALLRPGRFDKVIYVPPPDFDGRREIIAMHCQHWSKYIPEGSIIDIDYFAADAITGKMTGAEIVGACREAAMLCFREAMVTTKTDPSILSTSDVQQLVMKQEYLEIALKNVRPLLSNMSIMEAFESFQIERTRAAGS